MEEEEAGDGGLPDDNVEPGGGVDCGLCNRTMYLRYLPVCGCLLAPFMPLPALPGLSRRRRLPCPKAAVVSACR